MLAHPRTRRPENRLGSLRERRALEVGLGALAGRRAPAGATVSADVCPWMGGEPGKLRSVSRRRREPIAPTKHTFASGLAARVVLEALDSSLLG